MSIDVLAQWLPGLMEILVILIVMLVSVLPIIAFWKICSKAGFPGVLGLLMIIPIANVILPLYLAFADWPALRGNDQLS